MKAAFIHELQFLEDESGNLYLRGYDRDYWERYLKHFEVFYVVGRKRRVRNDEVRGFSIFLGDGLVYVEVPSVHSPLAQVKNRADSLNKIRELLSKVDCIITRQPGRYSDIAIQMCKRMRIPYLIEMVGCPWDSLWNHSLYGKLLAPVTALRTKRTLCQALYVIYVTKNFLQKRYPTKGKQTDCSNVTLPVQDGKVLDRRIQKIQGLDSEQRLLIGTVAAVDVRYKGQQFIIEALGNLKERGNRIYEYHLVGAGNQDFLKSEAKKFGVEDQVFFRGALTHKEVFEFLDMIDVYAQPSQQEGLPRALIEAMSRGLPCLGAKTGGIPELLDKEYIFAHDKDRIRNISTIISGFTKLSMKQQAGRNYMEADEYSFASITEKRDDMIKSFIEYAAGNGCNVRTCKG